MALGSPAGSPQPLHDERLARVASHAAIGLFEAGRDGAITFVTPRWCEITGVDDDAARGDGWFSTVHPDDDQRVRTAWREAVKHGAGLDIRYRAIAHNATALLRTLLEPVTDASGAITGFAGTTVGIAPYTERIAEAMPQMVWIASPDGKIDYFNRTWLEYTGIGVEQLSATGSKDVVHPDDVAETWARWRESLETGAVFEIEYRLRNAIDGTYRWFLARAMPVRDMHDAISQWVGTATDIDAQKRANANLRFVLEAAASLASSYDTPTICSELARLAVRRVADWCFIVLKTPGGEYKTVAIAHRDAQRVREAEALRERYSPLNAGPVESAIRRNRPVLIPSIDALKAQARLPQDAQTIELLQLLQMQGALIVPIAGAGDVRGALALVSSESGRAFAHDDLEVAEMVAERAADALQTAQAFGEERRRSADLEFIARASSIIFESLDMQSTYARLAEYVTKSMADLAYVVLIENGERVRTVAGAHRDPQLRPIARRMIGERTLRPDAEETAIEILNGARPILHKSVSLEAVLAGMWEYLAPDIRALDIRSAITVPLQSRSDLFGALIVYKCGDSRAYGEHDLPVFEDIGRRLSIAMDHARTLERERRIAQSLQQALLPDAAALPGDAYLRFSAEYRASTREADVGGDWYDARKLSDGSIAVSVGDVTGRGLQAAGLMGKLRQGMAMAAIYETDPARILDALDAQLRTEDSHAIATAFIGIIDPARQTLRYATAGHPPPLLRANGSLHELRSDGLPIGLRDAAREESRAVSLDGADLLMLYTDGLTEATRDIAFGEQRLQEVALSDAVLHVRNPAQFICDACLPMDAQDDSAVLTLSFRETTQWWFDADNAQAAHEARWQFVAHLRQYAGSDVDLEAAELIFGELIGNVVRHAPGPIDVQLSWTSEYPVLHVTDRGRGFIRNPSLPVDPLSESGRGLYIIALLARDVRAERIPGYGNHVAVELNVPRSSRQGLSI